MTTPKSVPPWAGGRVRFDARAGWPAAGRGTADSVNFVGVPVLPAAVALPACHIPARRAARVDPPSALRHEWTDLNAVS
jgi:hypothetical protein